MPKEAAHLDSLIDSNPMSQLPGNNFGSSRNLPKNDLGGVIFGCKHNTMEECLSKQLFGLPSTHFSYVRNIEEGLPLFLFNFSDRKLHGIFEAASRGQLNLNSYAWTNGSERTPFPAQAPIRIRIKCQPLTEDQFKKILEKNYYIHQHFWFELDHSQTRALIALFEPAPSPNYTKLIPGRKNMLVARQVTQPKPIDKNQSKQGNLNDFTVPVNLVDENTFPSLGWGDEEAERRRLNNMEHTGANASNPKDDACQCWVDEDTKQETLSNQGCTYADVCKKDTTLPCNLVDQNNFVPHGWGDEDTENGSLSKTMSYGPECIDNEEPVSDWEEWAEENARFSPSSACVPLPEGSQPLNENMAHDNVLKPNVEMVLFKLEKLANNRDRESWYKQQALTEKEDKVSASQPLHENTELMQFLIELKEWAFTFEMKQIESAREVQRLRNLLIDSQRRIQHLNNRVKELELKFDPSLAFGDSLNTFVEQCLGSEDFIYILGGFDGVSWLSALDSFSPSLDLVTPLKSMNFARSYASAVALDGNIYTFGGGDGSSWYDTVECYNRRNNEWTLCAPMVRKKGSLAGSTLHGKIYAIGGGDGTQCFSDVEMYDPALGKWINDQSMLKKRYAPAAAELNGVIYAVGGYDGHDYLKSAERYDPREAHWNRLGSMNTRRGCHSLAVLNEKLYAIGGYDGEHMVRSVEVFDPRMPSWVAIESMKENRGYAAAAVLGNTLFVMGGVKDGVNTLDTVESYREESGWQDTGLKGIGKRCFCSAIVI